MNAKICLQKLQTKLKKLSPQNAWKYSSFFVRPRKNRAKSDRPFMLTLVVNVLCLVHEGSDRPTNVNLWMLRWCNDSFYWPTANNVMDLKVQL
jgi:hypothetical protein